MRDRRSEQLASGFWILGTPRSVWPTPEPAVVRLRRQGMVNIDLTPSEARRLAEALIAEANHAETTT